MSISTDPRRLAIAFFHDEDGIVDDYMIHLVESLKPFVEKTIFVANGVLSKNSEIALNKTVETLILRKNEGFDVWAYKEALEHVGFDNIAQYDEVLLYNHTFYGPIFPFQEMFRAMEKRTCDFWGITAHEALPNNPFGGPDHPIPYHLNSHFIAVRKLMLTSQAFRDYWQQMEPIGSYADSVLKHESRFTKHFTDLGYEVSAYLGRDGFGSHYPAMLEVDESFRQRSPILKRRALFGDPSYLEYNSSDVARAINIMRETSDYDESMIWRNAARTSSLRSMNTNSVLMSILPDKRSLPEGAPTNYGNVAVCAHIYYTDMLDEMFAATSNIPVIYDFIATTDSEAKKAEIEKRVAQQKGIGNVIVRVMEQNRGRDMSALFITCRDLFLDDRYDIVLRIHSKKSPQVSLTMSNLFKRHVMDNLVHSRGYVSNVLDLMTTRPWIGLAFAPIVHIGYYTFGHSWYTNKPMAEEIARLLKVNVSLDDTTPVAPYGTMFWFRPKALRRLFSHEWKWTDFNAEPNHVDGGLAHAIERMISHVAASDGFTTEHIMHAQAAAFNYVSLEHKMDRLMSELPLVPLEGAKTAITMWRDAAANAVTTYKPTTISGAIRGLVYAFKQSAKVRGKRLLGR